MTIEEFEAKSPVDRLNYAHQNEEWLKSLNEAQLDKVGRLLCHASAKKVRAEFPIIGDLTDKQSAAQAEFEESIFGENATRRGEMPNV